MFELYSLAHFAVNFETIEQKYHACDLLFPNVHNFYDVYVCDCEYIFVNYLVVSYSKSLIMWCGKVLQNL